MVDSGVTEQAKAALRQVKEGAGQIARGAEQGAKALADKIRRVRGHADAGRTREALQEAASATNPPAETAATTAQQPPPTERTAQPPPQPEVTVISQEKTEPKDQTEKQKPINHEKAIKRYMKTLGVENPRQAAQVEGLLRAYEAYFNNQETPEQRVAMQRPLERIITQHPTLREVFVEPSGHIRWGDVWRFMNEHSNSFNGPYTQLVERMSGESGDLVMPNAAEIENFLSFITDLPEQEGIRTIREYKAPTLKNATEIKTEAESAFDKAQNERWLESHDVMHGLKKVRSLRISKERLSADLKVFGEKGQGVDQLIVDMLEQADLSDVQRESLLKDRTWMHKKRKEVTVKLLTGARASGILLPVAQYNALMTTTYGLEAITDFLTYNKQASHAIAELRKQGLIKEGLGEFIKRNPWAIVLLLLGGLGLGFAVPGLIAVKLVAAGAGAVGAVATATKDRPAQ